jgi:AraC-like DNA-binding protein
MILVMASDAFVGQVESFQSAASRAFAPLKVAPSGRTNFPNAFRSAAAGDIQVTRITGSPCTVMRTPGLICSSDPELVKVALHARGRAGVEQDGRRSLVRPGDLINYVTNRPYRLTFPEPYETVVIGVPLHRLGLHAHDLGQRTAIAVPTSGAVRGAVATFFRTVSEPLDVGPDVFAGDAGRHLADALVSMVISELVGVPVRAPDDHPADLADRILAYCANRLADPELTVESVAHAHHISLRYLHKVLRPRDLTLAAWIRRQRLERIRRDLADPALAGRTIASIAARWGVLNPEHLSRALKAEFGHTAAALRRAPR